jgi:hypothetical protein
MKQTEATHRLSLEMRRYADGESRGLPGSGVFASPVPIRALADKIRLLLATQGWKLVDTKEQRVGRERNRDWHGRWTRDE